MNTIKVWKSVPSKKKTVPRNMEYRRREYNQWRGCRAIVNHIHKKVQVGQLENGKSKRAIIMFITTIVATTFSHHSAFRYQRHALTLQLACTYIKRTISMKASFLIHDEISQYSISFVKIFSQNFMRMKIYGCNYILIFLVVCLYIYTHTYIQQHQSNL